MISYVPSASVSEKQFSVRHFNELPPGYSPPNYQETREAVTLKSYVSSEHLTLSDNACLEQAAVNKRVRDVLLLRKKQGENAELEESLGFLKCKKKRLQL